MIYTSKSKLMFKIIILLMFWISLMALLDHAKATNVYKTEHKTKISTFLTTNCHLKNMNQEQMRFDNLPISKNNNNNIYINVSCVY